MPNQEVMREWVSRLRSGDYIQGKGKLSYTEDDGVRKHCCLGVLTDMAVEAGVATPACVLPQPISRLISMEGHVVAETVAVYMYEDGNTTMPPTSAAEWADIPPGNAFAVGHDDPLSANKLAYLNDRGVPFDEIADRIEEEWIDLPDGTEIPDSPAAIETPEKVDA